MEESKKTTESKKPGSSLTGLILAGIMGGIIAGGLVIGYQGYAKTPPPDLASQIITVDLDAIMDHKRNSLIEKYKGSYTEDNAKIAEAEAKGFMGKLQEGIQKIQKDHVILAKKAVIGPYVDMTDSLIAYAEEGSNAPQVAPSSKTTEMKTKLEAMLKNEKE